ncbi:hypothetical protein [Pseudomonas sp. NMI795_08]|uniref:hypothetical protein n=1 Tax=Pseudomonas sp. NMI795_08 TaxID=2903144 RepID=UPI001E4D9C2F|nr:hypothetical protein [Pseudomonas sp. NMI795_08]MCE1119126.1 hypothetical protein [Pseudomonas sp. NMI795_08]
MSNVQALTPAQRIAGTILDQLGARRFMIMTGARDVVVTATGLQFRLPAKLTLRNSNMVRIELGECDTYTVIAGRWASFEFKERGRVEAVQAEQLQGAFTRLTGLDTHL